MMKMKIAIVATVVVAVVAALSAVFMPPFGEHEQRGAPEIFLNSEELIESSVEVSYEEESRASDTAHFLGERFYLSFVIQYRSDKVAPELRSISNSDLYPFELTGQADITHRDISDTVSEYRYKIEVMTVEALSGREYFIDEMQLRYSALSSGDVYAIDISPEHAFHVGQYGTVVPRPHMGALRYNFDLKQMLLMAGALLFLLAFMLFIQFNRERVALAHEGTLWETAEIEQLFNRLCRYKNEQWLSEESVRDRMSELRLIVLKLLHLKLDIGPYRFWTQKNDDALKKIRESMRPGFRQKDPEYADVVELAERTEKYLLVPDNERGG